MVVFAWMVTYAYLCDSGKNVCTSDSVFYLLTEECTAVCINIIMHTCVLTAHLHICVLTAHMHICVFRLLTAHIHICVHVTNIMPPVYSSNQ